MKALPLHVQLLDVIILHTIFNFSHLTVAYYQTMGFHLSSMPLVWPATSVVQQLLRILYYAVVLLKQSLKTSAQ